MTAQLDLLRMADELRAMTNLSLRYTQDPYQIERYERVLEIAAELAAFSTQADAAEMKQLFLHDRRYITPYSVVETATFDDEGRILLMRRADNGHWGLPGGACDVGETPSTGAAREAWEETGCIVDVDHLLGVFDGRYMHEETLHHLYIFLFHGRWVSGEPRLTRETVDVGWFTEDEVPWGNLSGHHDVRIRHAFRWQRDPSIPVHFEREPWEPRSTFQHET
ncbi:MAG: NUDIX hydrolase N-terminal domain-containing protein [Caldilineaceae bacterium]|nr:NUDIX hydrolase N-terminal domain-containing protein [Caldilineaceae bacterium]